jgi:hypothetical protein
MPLARITIRRICCQILIVSWLTPSVLDFLQRPSTAAWIIQSSPTASPLNAQQSFLTMLWSMASDTMPPGQSDVTGHLSFTYLSQGRIQLTHMENYLKFSNSTKTFDTLVLRYGWHKCGGSALGQGTERVCGMICAPHILLVIRFLIIYTWQQSC